MSDSYYGANVNAFLYMGAATGTSLPAPGADTFSEVKLTGSITPPQSELSTAKFNVTNDGNRRSLAGKKLDKVVEFDVVIDWTEPTHNSLFADANTAGGVRRNYYILYPDQNQRRLDFVGICSKWVEDPFSASDDAKEHHAQGTIDIDGAVAVTA